MSEFHQTGYGKTFFGNQLPRLICALERIAASLEKNEGKLMRCKDNIYIDGKAVFSKIRNTCWFPAKQEDIQRTELKRAQSYPGIG